MASGDRPGVSPTGSANGTGLLAAGTVASAADHPADSGWSTFRGSVVDEILGAPGAEALQPTARVVEAGIAFDHRPCCA